MTRRRLSHPARLADTLTSPVTVTTPHPEAWARAKVLADGDVKRLWTQADGSVLVLNQPIR